MYQIDFKKPIHIHFMGIGGVSMSGLAEILLKEGFTITGSDIHSTPITQKLVSLGAKIYMGQVASNIIEGIDLLVYTAAIHPENEEFQAAVAKGIPTMKRSVLLGQLMLNYKNSIAVSGTHGKTTTTSMLSHILIEAAADPTISVGGTLNLIKGNIRVGHSDMFITEACEYTNSFLDFFPKISVILNIEEDHMDFFKDIDDIRHSFKRFAQILPPEGLLVLNGGIDHVSYITDELAAPFVTYGIENNTDTYVAKNISYDELGHGHYDLYEKGKFLGQISLHVTGEHNIGNSLAAVAVSRFLHLPMDAIKKGILGFSGANRRFERKGVCNGFTVIDDYAHHPTEIRATLNACKNYPHKELWCIFQPHTYTRTIAFLDDFAKALSLCDHVILTDIYAAREKDTGKVHSKDIASKMKELGADVTYIKDFEEIKKFILNNCKKDDLLITMGAGNVDSIGIDLVNQ
ncbi:MAG: UDP-N-acetylmuramate--L-alanine ligase [Anaerostipes sp.]|nr:UDP-N-acetylmuramate--L-alanine ligase [Anaerostipes sp.]